MTTLQEYLNEKYPTEEAKSEVKELILTSITETLAGGELDLTAFSNLEKIEISPQFLSTPLTKIITDGLTKLKEIIWEQAEQETEEDKKLWEELGIAGDIIKKKVVREVQRLAKIKSVEIKFGEPSEAQEGVIFIQLDQKDKSGNFCPNLIFWNLAREITTANFPEKNPTFWQKFEEELGWIKENLDRQYQKVFTDLLSPSSFPHQQLEIRELLTIYFPNSEDIAGSQTVKTTVSEKIIDKTWSEVRQKLIELVSQELATEDKEKLSLKATLDYQNGEYIIQVQYHSQIPFGKEISELVIVAPLRFEIDYLKQKQEQLPTSESFEKLSKQNQLWDNYLQDFTDKEKYQEIKDKINKID
ncbi:protein of unknown function [endosymbiont DhMRE of Dentiscutata heterogama]|uniref:hypothetical protein n=1 Tax=endosymbiont DhMRE of Dentiscutata heterogama TaxID=1609546 RepID=UPI000629DCF8|nr:hypothetical protein [endosymbiont DhMRE of Dentiscutata heterogama]CFW92969.1 protein of unknown function [endosymbiont DhMRE of Dentiscutata heterogama]